MRLTPLGIDDKGQLRVGGPNDTNSYLGIPTVLSVTPVDFKVATTTDLFVVPSDLPIGVVVTDIYIRATSSSGLTIGATGSIGTNSTSFSNILNGLALGGVMTVGKVFKSPLSGASYAVALPGETIKGKITIGAIATGTFNCDVILVGMAI